MSETPPIMLGYAAIPRKAGKLSLGVQYALSLLLAVLGGLYFVGGVIAIILMVTTKGGASLGELIFNATSLTFSLAAMSFSLWLRQRVLRQRTALEPSATMGRRLDTLYAMAPWCMVVSGAIILAHGAACAAQLNWRDMNDAHVLVAIACLIGTGTLASGLAIRFARTRAARRLALRQQAMVPVAPIAASADRER